MREAGYSLDGARLDHIGIAVENMEQASLVYVAGLGLAVERVEEVPADGVRVAFLSWASSDVRGEGRLELLEPLGPDTPVGRFLRSRGPGLHHLAFAVPDIYQAADRAKAAGLFLIEGYPRQGAGGRLVAFIHPKSASGVLIELCQAGEHLGGDGVHI